MRLKHISYVTVSLVVALVAVALFTRGVLPATSDGAPRRPMAEGGSTPSLESNAVVETERTPLVETDRGFEVRVVDSGDSTPVEGALILFEPLFLGKPNGIGFFEVSDALGEVVLSPSKGISGPVRISCHYGEEVLDSETIDASMYRSVTLEVSCRSASTVTIVAREPTAGNAVAGALVVRHSGRGWNTQFPAGVTGDDGELTFLDDPASCQYSVWNRGFRSSTAGRPEPGDERSYRIELELGPTCDWVECRILGEGKVVPLAVVALGDRVPREHRASTATLLQLPGDDVLYPGALRVFADSLGRATLLPPALRPASESRPGSGSKRSELRADAIGWASAEIRISLGADGVARERVLSLDRGRTVSGLAVNSRGLGVPAGLRFLDEQGNTLLQRRANADGTFVAKNVPLAARNLWAGSFAEGTAEVVLPTPAEDFDLGIITLRGARDLEIVVECGDRALDARGVQVDFIQAESLDGHILKRIHGLHCGGNRIGDAPPGSNRLTATAVTTSGERLIGTATCKSADAEVQVVLSPAPTSRRVFGRVVAPGLNVNLESITFALIPDAGLRVYQASCGSNGAFEFLSVEPGAYLLQASSIEEGCVPPRRVFVSEVTYEDLGEIVVTPAVTTTLEVFGPDGTQIEHRTANVQVLRADDWSVVSYGIYEEGGLEIGPLSPGDYRVVVHGPDYGWHGFDLLMDDALPRLRVDLQGVAVADWVIDVPQLVRASGGTLHVLDREGRPVFSTSVLRGELQHRVTVNVMPGEYSSIFRTARGDFKARLSPVTF